MVAECFEQRNTGTGEESEDLGFAKGVVRLDVLGFDDDFEGAVFGSVDFGCDAAGDVVAGLVWAYPDAGIGGIFILIVGFIVTVSCRWEIRRFL